MKPLPLPLVCVVWDDAKGQGDASPISLAGANLTLQEERHTYGLLLRDDRGREDIPLKKRLVILVHDYDPPHDTDNATIIRADWVDEIFVFRKPPKPRKKKQKGAPVEPTKN